MADHLSSGDKRQLLGIIGAGAWTCAPVARVHTHTHTHTEIETLAKRDRGTNKKAEESCFSSPHTLGDKNEKDRYRHGGGTALTPTSDLKKKKAIISLVYLCCTPVRVLAVLLAVGPTARLNHFVWRGLAHSSVRARSHFRR